MKFATLLMQASTPLIFAHKTFHAPISDVDILKRDVSTCQATYGSGSITCGNSTIAYCYDPTAGETCCLLDNGYCSQGDVCAPVAGYCCHVDEAIQSCASRLSFTLPPSSYLTASTTTTSVGYEPKTALVVEMTSSIGVYEVLAAATGTAPTLTSCPNNSTSMAAVGGAQYTLLTAGGSKSVGNLAFGVVILGFVCVMGMVVS